MFKDHIRPDREILANTAFAPRRFRKRRLSARRWAAALAGQRPIAEIMLMNFVGVCMDQIVNHAAKLRFMSGGQTPLPDRDPHHHRVSGVGFGGQHSDMLEAWFAHVAGIHVVTPSNAADGARADAGEHRRQ